MLLISHFETPVNKLSSDSSMHSISDSFESATFTALQTGRLPLFATNTDDDAALTTALAPAQDHIPHTTQNLPLRQLQFLVGQLDVALTNLTPLLNHDLIPFGLTDIAPFVPEPVPAPVELPLGTIATAPAPADVTHFLLWSPTSITPVCLLLSFKTYPHPGKELQVSTRITIFLLPQHFPQPHRSHRLLHSPLQRWTSHFNDSYNTPC
ncbi:hypothetical protein HanHA300_Chr16g0598991 [Helianthus annuus]|nr:hypothetical protein HanHA300_Chr16g0598991 [Helianthus annuus]KAJ0459479.1 hypothetical protein HanHA89_Chr16g0649421 [Helianthus annuus]